MEPDWYSYKAGAPFSVGDVVTINEQGFSIKPGDEYKVVKMKWVSSLKEWCLNLNIDTCHKYGWRARRFELVKSAKEKTMNKKYNFALFNVDEYGNISPGSVRLYQETDYADMDTTVKAMLKENPNQQVLYGRLDRHAFVDMPPIKIKQL